MIVVTAKHQTVSDETTFVGRVRATARVEVRARVEGVLQKVAFRDGQLVKANALLFRIEPDRFEAKVQLAEAQLARAEAKKVEADKALWRAQQLIKRGNIPQARVDSAEATSRTAKADVLSAKAELRVARLNLSYTEIRSPIAGRVDKAAFKIGNLVNAGSGVLTTVTKTDPVHVDFSISERAIVEAQRRFAERGGKGNIRESVRKTHAALKLPNGKSYGAKGRLIFLSAEVDALTGSVPLRAVFPNPQGLLLHNQFVTVVLSRQRTSKKIVLPQTAIQEDQAGTFVLVLDKKNLVQIRRIRAGSAQGTGRVIEQGLEVGEVVIVAGVQRVRPGVAVTPVFSDRKKSN